MKHFLFPLAAMLLAGCASVQITQPQMPPPVSAECPVCLPIIISTQIAKAPIMFVAAEDSLPSFVDRNSRTALLKAAELNRKYFKSLKTYGITYLFGTRKITTSGLAAATDEFIRILSSSATAEEVAGSIRAAFDAYQLAGRDSTGTVVFSSYYEPTLSASLKRTGLYKYPIYAKPPDLINIDLGDFNDKFKGETLSGRLKEGRLVPYIDRDEIDFKGALDGKNLELAWLTDRADTMNLHIEGSGRLKLPDGKIVKAKFAATNSLKFKGWLTALVEAGAIRRDQITHERGQQYLRDNPGLERGIMTQNRRYTFFRLEEITDPEEGPSGTYGLPLVPWRSIAIDNTIIPMGTLAYMTATVPDVDEKGVFKGKTQDSRFVFCQDTGGAIKGPGRVDFFAGHTAKAETFAFKLWDTGNLYLLVLKE